VKEAVQRFLLKVVRIGSAENRSDGHTKPLIGSAFEDFCVMVQIFQDDFEQGGS